VKKTVWILATLFFVLLSGCSWMDGKYHYIVPHEVQTESDTDGIVTAGSFVELRSALENMVMSGKKNGVIYIRDMDADTTEEEMNRARSYILHTYPIGAYAVDTLTFEVGTSGGVPAAAVQIEYLHSRSEIQRIETVSSMDDVLDLTGQILDSFGTELVVMVEQYSGKDIVRYIQEYADAHPDRIMEVPQISIGMYPEAGSRRVIELKFTYQNTTDILKTMRNQVKPYFDAAKLYVTVDGDDHQKYTQLHAFLMERFEYQFGTSITPTYSLLRHGVGDSKTFALVYAAMCRDVDLECRIVTGTRDGEPWYWNIICDNGNYFHLDLLGFGDEYEFTPLSDDQMDGYVWNYSLYPECPPVEEELPDPSEPTEEALPDTEQDEN